MAPKTYRSLEEQVQFLEESVASVNDGSYNRVSYLFDDSKFEPPRAITKSWLVTMKSIAEGGTLVLSY
jgi:hypothetical protein